jgi:ferric-dicitrate binding protein FerR (iron transport regulator)
MRYAAVAVFVFAVLVGGVVSFSLFEGAGQPRIAMQTVECDAGLTRTVTFPDGTRVTLKGASTLSFRGDYAESRDVTLDGEAYFVVASDAERPFTVTGKCVKVTVRGTEFNMRSAHNNGMAEVVLVEGSVDVVNLQGRRVVLGPGHKVEVDAENNTMEVADAGEGEMARHSGGPLSLEDVSLHEALFNISEYFGVRMEISPTMPEVRGVVLYLSANETLEHAMEMVQATNPVFNYTLYGDMVKIR